MPTPEISMRDQILSTAKNLFIQQGYHGLAMRQIAEALGVTKAALYYHFKDKEELFMAILESYLDEMGMALDHIIQTQETARKQVKQFVEYILSQPAEERAIIRLASQEIGQVSPATRKAFARIYREKFIGKVESILQRGIDNGEFRPAKAEVATHALLGIMYPYLYPSGSGDHGLSPETIQQIVAIFLDGVCNQ